MTNEATISVFLGYSSERGSLTERGYFSGVFRVERLSDAASGCFTVQVLKFVASMMS